MQSLVSNSGTTSVLFKLPAFNGFAPNAELIQSAGVLYGTTSEGGNAGLGTIFSMATNGTAFTVLHQFMGGVADGAEPNGSLLLSGGILYGVASGGGATNVGIVYKIATDGSGFAILHSFDETSATDGAYPSGAITLSAGVLYGVTNSGGASDSGTVYKINTDGTGFAVLYSFTGGNDGSNPRGQLTLSAGTLYGVTGNGGANGVGVAFSVDTTGASFTTLHAFDSIATDGSYPNGSLLLSAGVLYGITSGAGANGYGAVYSMNTNGTGFTLVHSFASGPAEGGPPSGSLLLSGGVLYGTVVQGGASNGGLVYSVNTNGTGFTLVHSFANFTATDGMQPYSGVTLVGGALYGMTSLGGADGAGMIYTVATNGTGFSDLHDFTGATDGQYLKGSPAVSGNTLYFTAYQGGSGGLGSGTLVSVGTDGSNPTLIHTFSGIAEGGNSNGTPVISGSKIYGATTGNGWTSYGSIFSVNTDGSAFTVLHAFANDANGYAPVGNLLLSSGVLYGMNTAQGANNVGNIFSMNTDGSGYTVLHDMDCVADGCSAGGGVVGGLIQSGSTLYGITYQGGAFNAGTIFKINTNGTGFAVIHTFDGSVADGAYSYGKLTLVGGVLYGMTGAAGANGAGTIFSINTDGSGFNLLHSFAGPDGSSPYGNLVYSGGSLYGFTSSGGANNAGTLFTILPNGTGFTTLSAFGATLSDGADPFGDPLIIGDTIYGTTYSGGYSSGTIIKYQ